MATFRCNNYPSFGFNTPEGVGYYFERGRFCTDDLPDEVAEAAEKTLRSLMEYGVDIFEDGIDYGSQAVQEVEEAESTTPDPPTVSVEEEVEDDETREGDEEEEFAFLERQAPLGAGPGPGGPGIPEGSELRHDS